MRSVWTILLFTEIPAPQPGTAPHLTQGGQPCPLLEIRVAYVRHRVNVFRERGPSMPSRTSIPTGIPSHGHCH